MSETTWTTRDGRMTDDMLDQLDILASEFVHRTGHSEILVVPRLVAEIKRLRAILSALREPSVGAVDAAWAVYQAHTWWDERDDMSRAIRAAVAAAEQEVGRE